MDQSGDLGRLEKIIEQLLTSFSELKKEKARLESRLQGKEQEIASLKEQLAKLEQDKDQVHLRVSRLITAIENWEIENAVENEQIISDEPKDEEAAQKKATDSLMSLTG